MNRQYFIYTVLLSTILFPLITKGNPISTTIDISDSQISNNSLSNDVWMSDWIDIGTTINNQESLQLDVLFSKGKRLKGDDGYFNGDESIKFFIDGSALNNFVWPYNEYKYKWWFTGIQGTAPVVGTASNPITGLQGINDAGGNDNENISVDIIEGGNFSFTDIHFEFVPTSITQPWTINRIRLGFDADDISSIPEPGTLTLMTLALLGIGSLGIRKSKMKTAYA